MAKLHYILDFETMGQDVNNCVILDCSYVVFDWERFLDGDGYTFRELEDLVQRAKLDVAYQVKHMGYIVDKSSVKWWSEQEPKVREKIKPSAEDITPQLFLNDMANYIDDLADGRGIKAWWSRSNTFDPIILWRLTDGIPGGAHAKKHLPHWKIRDTRTFIDAKTNFSLHENGFCPVENGDAWNSVFEKHNSSHDIIADILRMQTLTRVENDLPWSKIG